MLWRGLRKIKSNVAMVMLINNAILSKIFDTKARNWYEQEAVRESWSVRTL
jgi:hypothetical protein